MSSSLHSVIARLAEIERLQSQMAAERDELLIAKRVLERLEKNPPQRPLPPPPPPPHRPLVFFAPMMGEPSRPPRLAEFFLKTLQDADPPWMTANEVQVAASTLKGSEIPMSSVSPTLTDLKNKGLVARDGLKVALATRVQTIGAPASEPTEAS